MSENPESTPQKVGLGDSNWKAIDVSVENHGSVIIFRPLSDAAKSWIEEYVSREGYQPFRDALVVEPRFADNLLTGMQRDGLHISI